MLREAAEGARTYRRRVRRPFPFRLWTAGAAAAIGIGLLLGLPSAAVPDAAEPIAGAALLALAARTVWRARQRARRS